MYIIKHTELNLFYRGLGRLVSNIERAKVWNKRPSITLLNVNELSYNPNRSFFINGNYALSHSIQGQFEIRKAELNLI